VDESALEREYYAILSTVSEFDKRLLTVKGWGVTLSLAALAWGFQYKHCGLFLVSALSGLSFWLIEGAFKRHQMRYYLRMREIEVIQYKKAKETNSADESAPRIDWSWSQASKVFSGIQPDREPAENKGLRLSYRLVLFFPHVFLPHALSIAAGLWLFWLARNGKAGFELWPW